LAERRERVAAGLLYVPGKGAPANTSRRELIEPHEGDKRYVRRGADDQFKKQTDVGKSLSNDRRYDAKTRVKRGDGDHGDR
jgi:hypothetical protein